MGWFPNDPGDKRMLNGIIALIAFVFIILFFVALGLWKLLELILGQ